MLRSFSFGALVLMIASQSPSTQASSFVGAPPRLLQLDNLIDSAKDLKAKADAAQAQIDATDPELGAKAAKARADALAAAKELAEDTKDEALGTS